MPDAAYLSWILEIIFQKKNKQEPSKAKFLSLGATASTFYCLELQWPCSNYFHIRKMDTSPAPVIQPKKAEIEHK